MRFFDQSSYIKIIQKQLQSMPANGYGELSKIAEYIGVNTSFVSQVLKGDKDFSYDQAHGISEYFQWSESETDYFLLLVLRARAGTPRAQKRLDKKIEQARLSAQEIKSRIRTDRQLTDEEMAVFYSHWGYAAVQLATAVPNMNSAEKISLLLNLPKNFVHQIIQFLIETDLCIATPNGLRRGPASTHVDSKSPHVHRHHQNWRLQSLQQMTSASDDNLFFTFPFSVSQEDYLEIRKRIVTAIDDIRKFVEPSKDEALACFNIDYFKVSQGR